MTTTPALPLVFAIAAVAALTACTSHHRHYAIGVNAISALPGRGSRTFTIVSGDPAVSENDLQFREFATYVRRMLQSRQFVYSADPASAAIAVTLAYGIGRPHTEVTIRSVPLFSTQRQSGSAPGQLPRYTTTRSGTETEVDVSTSYRRYLDLRAVDLNSYRVRNEIVWLWQVEVASRGPSEDLRSVMPYLVAAARRYVDHTTQGTVPIRYDTGERAITADLYRDP